MQGQVYDRLKVIRDKKKKWHRKCQQPFFNHSWYQNIQHKPVLGSFMWFNLNEWFVFLMDLVSNICFVTDELYIIAWLSSEASASAILWEFFLLFAWCKNDVFTSIKQPHALHLNRARYGLAWLSLSCLGETMTTTTKEREKQNRWQTICERKRTKKYNLLQQPFTTERCRRRHRATGVFCFCFVSFWRATARRWVINTGVTFWLWKCNILRGGNAGKHPQQVF